ncbi:MAG: glycosyltransferase [Mycobacterium sp.]|nr:MAG: glycosyltransferase [Mycobacterium sp.]
MYNNGATIARCLRSIVEQDGDFELLVVDDDSSDDSAAIAETMLRAGDRLIRNDSNLGGHGNHTKCLELARGSLIQFVHGDDWLLPGALTTLARCLEDPSAGMAFAPRRVVTDDADWLRNCGTLHTHFRKLREHNEGSSLVTQLAMVGLRYNWIGEVTSVMFRRRLALSAGGIRDDIFHLADLDLWLRLMVRSTVYFVPQELSVRCHTAFTAEEFAAQTWWLDNLRIITWMIVDPASPAIVRIISVAWWLPAWLTVAVGVILLGPDRRSRLKILALAPFREFSHAWRLRRGLAELPASTAAAG